MPSHRNQPLAGLVPTIAKLKSAVREMCTPSSMVRAVAVTETTTQFGIFAAMVTYLT